MKLEGGGARDEREGEKGRRTEVTTSAEDDSMARLSTESILRDSWFGRVVVEERKSKGGSATKKGRAHLAFLAFDMLQPISVVLTTVSPPSHVHFFSSLLPSSPACLLGVKGPSLSPSNQREGSARQDRR